MKHTAAVVAMVEWFLINFEDPAVRTPWDEGEYVFIGAALAAREMNLENAFGGVATERAIAAAVDRIEEEGDLWVPSGLRMQSHLVNPKGGNRWSRIGNRQPNCPIYVA